MRSTSTWPSTRAGPSRLVPAPSNLITPMDSIELSPYPPTHALPERNLTQPTSQPSSAWDWIGAAARNLRDTIVEVGRSVIQFGRRCVDKVVSVFRQGIADSNQMISPHVVRFTERR
ncbi:hypothetical protein K491DRAFT_213950 [Lophiostoma macrostomum CBS 122681]|uniref:Uncharacterized protein n=1 Tax=Lophiostoma macrostomum CBS 122681 TaxID=1314788 RepID=A0A6A6SQC2_9PLEO|nr:hypothetical protein K491DRAFT_213950 [Lophiostoma macrostomum CBS 122681]